MTSKQDNLSKQLALLADTLYIEKTRAVLIHCICAMNIDALQLFLDDSKSYQDTTKSIFLKKLNAVFLEFKRFDTKLLPYEGNCCGKKCSNCTKKGIAFVGNESGDYLNLIIETENNNCVKDIYNCDSFSRNIVSVDTKNKIEYYILVRYDEVVNFKGSAEYWSNVSAVTAAYIEIITNPVSILDFEQICYWLDKHHFTYEKLDYDIFNPAARYSDFFYLYDELNETRVFIDKYKDQIFAANKFIKPNMSDDQLIDWVIRQETIYDAACFKLKCEYGKKEDFYTFENKSSVNFDGEVFDEIFTFLEFFVKNKNELFEKYRVYDHIECVDIYNKTQDMDNANNVWLLSFHIQKRKQLELTGIELPLYIDNNTR